MKKLSIIIPAYNEGKRIGPTLDDYCNYFKHDTEIIVILNNCTDNTEDIVKEYLKKYPSNLTYYLYNKFPGKGAAVYYGFSKAKGDLIGFVDADKATSAEEYQKLIDAIGENDGVIASRFLPDSKISKRSLLRSITSVTFRIIVKLLFFMPYTDTQCGAKIFKKEVISKLLPEVEIKNMDFDVEILYMAKKKGFKIIEVPTVWIDKSSSAVLGSPLNLLKNSITMFLTLFKIRFK